MTSNISADIIHLKNGKKMEGKYLGTNKHYLTLDTFSNTVQISIDTVLSVEMGYSGSNICLAKNEESTMDCSVKIHLWTKERIVILTGKNYSEPKILSTNEYKKLVWEKKGGNIQIFPFLETGIYIGAVTSNQRVEGNLQQIEDDHITILTESGEKKTLTIHSIEKLESIQASHWSNKFRTSISQYSIYTLPGLYQWQKNETWKGGILMGATILTSLATISSFQNLQKISQQNNPIYIPYNNQILIAQNPNTGSNYRSTQNQANILSGLLGLIFIYHFWDVWNSDTDFVGLKKSPSIDSRSSLPSFHSKNNFQSYKIYPSSEEFHLESVHFIPIQFHF